MTSNVSFVFMLVLPCISVVIAGMLLLDWRLVAATACGAIGLFYRTGKMPDAVRVFGSSTCRVALDALLWSWC
jgi:hypothetical protein